VTPLLLFDAMLRTSAVVLAACAVVRLLRIREPATERAVWLMVLWGSAFMPVAMLFAHGLLPSSATSIAIGSTSLQTAQMRLARAIAWISPIYLGVSSFLIARLVLGLVVLARLWREAVPVPALVSFGVPVRASHRLTTPVTVGRGILVPADWARWDGAHRAGVLAHELSHVHRSDFLWHVFAQAHVAVFWANPLSWFLRRRLVLLAELLSDDDALATQPNRADYAALLVTNARLHRSPVLAVGLTQRSGLAVRLERILRVRSSPTVERPRLIALARALIVMAMAASAAPSLAPVKTTVLRPGLGSLSRRLPPLAPLATLR